MPWVGQRPAPKPGEIDPELRLLPHLTGVGLVGAGDALSRALESDAADGLTKGDPLPRVGLLALV